MSKKRRTKSEKSKKKKKKKKSSESGEEDEYGVAPASVEEEEVKEDSDYGTSKRSSKRNRTPKAPDTPQQGKIILDAVRHVDNSYYKFKCTFK